MLTDISPALTELYKLDRFVSMIDTHDILSKDIEANLNDSLEQINKLSNPLNDIIQLEHRQIKYIQLLIDRYQQAENKNIRSIIKDNKTYAQILLNLEKFSLNGKKLYDEANRNFVRTILRALPIKYLDSLSEPLMIKYLSSTNWKNNTLILIVRVCFKSKRPNNPLYIENLDLYFSDFAVYNAFENNLRQEDYQTALKNIGILPQFIKTDYFVNFFFYWFMHYSKINLVNLIKNEFYFKCLTPDEKILILAKVITKMYESESIDNFEVMFNKLNERIKVNTKLDKTEELYWTLTDNRLKTDDNLKLLENAHRYCCIVLERDLVTQFFDILGNSDYITMQRAQFWRRYIVSQAFRSIRFVLTDDQLYMLKRNLKVSSLKAIDRYVVNNYKSSKDQSPAIIFKFQTKVVVEFLKLSNASYVYNTYNFNNLFGDNLQHVSSISTLKSKLISGSVFDSHDGEGRIIHNNAGDWMSRTKILLSRFGIRQ